MTSQTATLKQPIADFTFATTENKSTTFQQYRGKNLLLYFYPKDNTPGCTLESRAFAQAYPEFLALNTEIIGVSRDDLSSHDRFKNNCGLPFPLASDPDETLCRYFDVIKMKTSFGIKRMGLERSTFLIDKEGVLRKAWRNVKVLGHDKAVLEAVKAL